MPPLCNRLFTPLYVGYLLSSSPRHAQAPLAPPSDPSDDPSTRRAFHADERDRNTHNMLYSDGLIDFRSIVRLLPPNGSSETPFERQASGEEDRAEESDNLRTTVDRLTRTQLAVVLDSDEIVWLEVCSAKGRAQSNSFPCVERHPMKRSHWSGSAEYENSANTGLLASGSSKHSKYVCVAFPLT